MRQSMAMTDADHVLHNAFASQDKGDKGFLTRIELQACIQGVTGQDFTMDHIETLYSEFDKDENGKVDWPEFKTMVSFLQGTHKKRPSVRIFLYFICLEMTPIILLRYFSHTPSIMLQ